MGGLLKLNQLKRRVLDCPGNCLDFLDIFVFQEFVIYRFARLLTIDYVHFFDEISSLSVA